MKAYNIKKNIVLFLILFLISFANGQYGKNKVCYDEFDWNYIQTEHLDIFFYEGGEELAKFAAPIAERQFKRIQNVLKWEVNKRTALLIYNSHNDFQQTNVTLSYMTEGIGGFTELFKNRAVVAFEGDYHGFWHVIKHELVHVVVNDMVYGGNIQSVISGRVQLNIPLWMNEGLAEYLSWNWDTHADLMLRDIAMSNNIPDIKYLDYYMAYKGGQSVYQFISQKYGEEKIGEIWRTIKSKKNVDKGFEACIGMDTEELSEEWHKWLRREYWPEVADRDELESIAIRITDHKKLKNHFNTAPAISPNGEKIAFISDRNGYADIYLASARDGEILKRVVRGQKSPDLEEIKWLNPRLSWSPDGKELVLATKSGNTDALIMVNVETGDIKKKTFDNLEEIFSAAWSPEGDKIAFIGLKQYYTDVYCYHIKEDRLEQFTDDIFSDFEPSWSPDGSKIIFSSQRGCDGEIKKFKLSKDISRINYHQKDLFILDSESKEIHRVTNSPYEEDSPIWMKQKNEILFCSDESGITNFYTLNLETNKLTALSNVLTGAFQPSMNYDDTRLVFAGYSDQGWDIYSISNPMGRSSDSLIIAPTGFVSKRPKVWEQWAEKGELEIKKDEKFSVTRKIEEEKSYSNYIFAPGYDEWKESNESPYDSEKDLVEKLDSVNYQTKEGEFVVNEYKTKLSLDLVDNRAGYSTFWGFQGTTVFSFSDVLGNHRILFGTEMYLDLENSDYYLSYQYLTNKTNIYFSAFHSANFYSSGYYSMWRLRNYGASTSFSRPLSKFTRLEYGLTLYNVEQNLIDILTSQTLQETKIHTILPQASWVFDNTLWAYFYPIDGWRARADLTGSPRYNKNSLEFVSLNLDFRRYFKLNREYSFALRFSGGISEGKNAQRFFLGGETNWINQKFKHYHNFSNAEDIYFSRFITPLRGARYYEREGTRYFLTNFEFRYPFIKYLQLGWPIPLITGGIQGVTFLDIGSAWHDSNFHPFTRTAGNDLIMDDLVGGYGFGTRLFFGYFLLKIDIAWRFDLHTIHDPQYYFSLGMDF